MYTGCVFTMSSTRRFDFIGLSQDPNNEAPRLLHLHDCPDGNVPSFPFGPLMRGIGVCQEAIPFCCSSCGRTTYQACRSTYRVAHTGADWNDHRPEFCHHREMPVLVQCEHCNAPSDFHLHLALFKEYYEEVFDMVRDGRVTLYDLRRSVTVVSFWPPRTGGSLLPRLSRLASQVSEAIASVSSLPVCSSSLVLEYWQGATHDYFSSDSSFACTWELYKCNHV